MEMSDLTTVPVEKPENLGKGHAGIYVVLQELRAISSRLSQVENSIDSQSNTRTSTPHRICMVHSVVVQECKEVTGVAVPVSSSSVGACFAPGPPVSTMASAACQYTSPPGLGMFDHMDRLLFPNHCITYILGILLSFIQQVLQLSCPFMVVQLAVHGRDRVQQGI